jgi:asparagine synthase (glutamine-hydrolysing)
MTAIFGLWHRSGRPDLVQDSARMQRSLAIYGDDRRNHWHDDEIALGVDLSFLTPEDRLDRQPLCGGGGRFELVADIRLDNRPELAAMLAIPAERAREMADADFALAAWERWRAGALDRLIGDYALAIWDSVAKTLTLARDFLGNRPLFYRAEKNRFAFASMAKGIHALPDVPIAPDFDTLRDQLALLPMRGPKSHFAGVNRVEPGLLVIARADGRVECREWYEWRLDRDAGFTDDDEAVEAFRSTFDRAVADRLRAIGPIGSQLSSGFDSSAVTATAAIQLGKKGKRLSAYTHVPLAGVPLYEPPGRTGNEWPLAHILADRYANIDHIAVEAAERQIGADFDSEFFYNEYPAINPNNALWVNEIFRTAAQRKEKVMLSGSVGNATISSEGQQRLAELLASGNLLTWWREATAYVRQGASRRHAFVGLTLLPLLPPQVVYRLYKLCGQHTWQLADYTALHPGVITSLAFRKRVNALGFDTTFAPRRNRRAMVATALRRIDSAPLYKGLLGAFGVDHRDPTSDRRIVELSLSLPSRMFFREGRGKWIFRQAFSSRIPSEILNARDKGIQTADWLTRLHNGEKVLKECAQIAQEKATVMSLIDTDTVEILLATPLPEKPTRELLESHVLKLLRGLSVAHFISKAELSNRQTPEHGSNQAG